MSLPHLDHEHKADDYALVGRALDAYQRHMQAPLLSEPQIESNRYYHGTVVYPDGHTLRGTLIRWEAPHLRPQDCGLFVNTSEWDKQWHRWDRRCTFLPDTTD